MSQYETAVRSQLEAEANRIYQLIQTQREHLCYAQCPVFEEVVDTQMYGLSKQVALAISVGLLKEAEGHQLLTDLDDALNQVYTEAFEAQQQERHNG